MLVRTFVGLFLSVLALLATGCEKQMPENRHYKTQHVVIVVIDGPRYSETWGCTVKPHIPVRMNLAHEGVVATAFANNGETYTTAGHTAITTGVYQSIHNGGAEYPEHPSLFQFCSEGRKDHRLSSCKIISSKDKLEVLSDCNSPEWHGRFRPLTDCGFSGLGTGNRPDSLTLQNALATLANEDHQVMLICFREPDTYAHANDWPNYIRAIETTDAYTGLIWEAIQQSSTYAGNTTLFVTNDHGRHPTDFTSHGDGCEGCRHIEMMALGPDFHSGYVTSKPYEQVDIPPTVAELMNFQMGEACTGKVMWDLFK